MGAKKIARWALRSSIGAALVALMVPGSLPPAVAAAEESERADVSGAATGTSPEPGNLRHAPARKSKSLSVGGSSAKTRHAVAHASAGEAAGLHRTPDPLALKSSAAMVIDQDTDEVLFSKNADVVLPIASLTKLMTALVIAQAKLPLDELVILNQDDVDTERHSPSRLKVGTQLTRGEMLHLALMASENRAAHALGRTYPGGTEAFVAAMNATAETLNMHDSSFVEATGLSSGNKSSARDLVTLVRAAHEHPIIRDMSVSPKAKMEIGRRNLQFNNTNRLVRRADWDIGLQKTGYISEAGRCLVMQVNFAGRSLIMVFLDSVGKYSRLGDAERVRRWITDNLPPATNESVAQKLTS